MKGKGLLLEDRMSADFIFWARGSNNFKCSEWIGSNACSEEKITITWFSDIIADYISFDLSIIAIDDYRNEIQEVLGLSNEWVNASLEDEISNNCIAIVVQILDSQYQSGLYDYNIFLGISRPNIYLAN